MSVIVSLPEPNLWEEICKEFSQQKPPVDDDRESVTTDYDDFNPAVHNPVFYGKMFSRTDADGDLYEDFDSAVSHPSCVGYSFTSKPQKVSIPPAAMPPNRFTCTPTEYLNYYVFPYLLPALEAMLKQAKMEKCFEDDKADQTKHRRKTKFNACDFITEYLYKNNPYCGQETRKNIELWDIPFVKNWLLNHSRPPLPLSLILTEDEASIIIQSFWRGYLVRREAHVQELRIWQREWREENHGIQNRVSEFWNKQMPNNGTHSEDASGVVAEDTPVLMAEDTSRLVAEDVSSEGIFRALDD